MSASKIQTKISLGTGLISFDADEEYGTHWNTQQAPIAKIALNFETHESVDPWDQIELPGAGQVALVPLVADQLKFDPLPIEIVVGLVAFTNGKPLYAHGRLSSKN